MALKKVSFNFYGTHAAAILGWFKHEWIGYNRQNVIGRAVKKVGVATNGEVYYEVDTWECRKGKDDTGFAVWAYTLKKAMEYEWRITGTSWKDSLNQEICLEGWTDYSAGEEHKPFTTTVAHLRALYELLLGRDIKKQSDKYSQQVIDDIIGHPADPFVTMQRELLNVKIKEVNDDLAKNIHEMEMWCQNEKKRIQDEFENRRRAARKASEDAIIALKAQFATVLETHTSDLAEASASD